MYLSQREHGIPHFHAIYSEYNAVYAIETIQMLEGDLPPPEREGLWRNGENYASLFHRRCGNAGNSGSCPVWSNEK